MPGCASADTAQAGRLDTEAQPSHELQGLGTQYPQLENFRIVLDDLQGSLQL